MGQSGTGTTVTQSADPWYKGQAAGLYSQGVDFLNRTPYSTYQGSQVAGFQPAQLAAQDFISRNLYGQSLPYQAPRTYGPFSSTPPRFQQYTEPDGRIPTGRTAQPRDPGQPGRIRDAILDPTGDSTAFMSGRTAPPGAPPGPRYTTAPEGWELDAWNARVGQGLPQAEWDELSGGDSEEATAIANWIGQNDIRELQDIRTTVVPGSSPLGGTPTETTQTEQRTTHRLPADWSEADWQDYQQRYGAWTQGGQQGPPPLPRGVMGDGGGMGGLGGMGGGGMDGLFPPFPEPDPTINPEAFASPQGTGLTEARQAADVARRLAQGGNVPNALLAYRDPYENEVVNRTLGDLDRSRQLATQDDRSRATLSGAFGGDRAALLEAETNRGYADTAARTVAQLRSQGFDRAANLAQMDADRSLQGAGLLSSLGGDIFSRTLGTGQALSGLGAEQQGMAQDTIGADLAQFYEAQQDPYQRFGWLSGLLSGVPQGQSQTTYTPRNRGAGFLGGALSGAGIGSTFGLPGALVGGGLGGLLGLF